MPNHVDNDLLITGPEKDRARFRRIAKTKDGILDANVFIPYPENFKKLDRIAKDYDEEAESFAKKKGYKVWWEMPGPLKKQFISKYGERPRDGFNQGGYDWCCQNWGTKWGMYDTTVTSTKARLFYNFSSAWSPPIPIILAMSEQFKTLTFKLSYYEGAMGFQGVYECRDGAVITDMHGDYSGSRGG